MTGSYDCKPTRMRVYGPVVNTNCAIHRLWIATTQAAPRDILARRRRATTENRSPVLTPAYRRVTHTEQISALGTFPAGTELDDGNQSTRPATARDAQNGRD